MRRQGDVASVTMSSGDGEEQHLTAEARHCDDGPTRTDPNELRARCTRPQATRNGHLDQDFVQFGPRWRNIREIRFGTREAVIDLELPTDFAADLPHLAYHPALLDMATGAAQGLIPGFDQATDFLVPFGYDRVRFFAPVTARCFSHVRLRPESTPAIAVFDVRVFDPTGNELIAVDGFTMKRVDKNAAIARNAPPPGADAARQQALAALLREAIAPAEGVAAFDRILSQPEACHVVASSVDVEAWRRKLAREALRLRGGESGESTPSFSRPALANDFVAPAPGLEAAIAAIWSKLLGVGDVGAEDDFFELGGNSLIAVRFFTRAKREFGVDMPLSTLFQSPTIRRLAATMQSLGVASGTPVQSPVVAASAETAAQPTTPAQAGTAGVAPPILIRPGDGQLPVFLVHDGLGEVLLYRSLALLLDPGHPVYGLDPERQDGRVVHTSIVAMARAKVERIRQVQPRGPYLLAGLCAGGVIAVEIARQLEAAGEAVRFVGILDAADVAAEEKRFRIAKERLQRVRDLLRPEQGTASLRHWLSAAPKLVRKARNWLGYTIGSRLERRRDAAAVAAMRSAEATPGSTSAPDFLRIYELAHREHRADGVLRAPVVALFRATSGSGAADDIPFREIYADPMLGWQARFERPVLAIDVPGGHTSLLQEPHVGILARDFTHVLRGALADGATTRPSA